MSLGFLKNQKFYIRMTFVLAILHVTIMTYVMRPEWIETASAISFLDSVGTIFPALHELQQHSPPYTPFWGMYYALFFCIAPIYFILGLATTFFFSEKVYEGMRSGKSKAVTFVFLYLISIIFSLIPFFFTFTNHVPNVFFNQMSPFFLLRILAWWTTGMFPFTLGWMTGCMYQNYLNRKMAKATNL